MNPVTLIEIGGSLLILAAFAAAQAGRLDVRSVAYLVLNVAGAAVLAVIAAFHASWGFLLLEGTWTIVSAVSLVSVLRRRGSPVSERRRGSPVSE
jgi:hypothetical protein